MGLDDQLVLRPRRSGRSAEDAKDLTQGFFAVLLDKGWLEAADREKGKLRTFLLTAFRRFMAKEWRRGQAEVRGGMVALVSWEEGGAELRSSPRRGPAGRGAAVPGGGGTVVLWRRSLAGCR